ncbi:hypothetical protein YC2023_110523 [Brassica napus]
MIRSTSRSGMIRSTSSREFIGNICHSQVTFAWLSSHLSCEPGGRRKLIKYLSRGQSIA